MGCTSEQNHPVHCHNLYILFTLVQVPKWLAGFSLPRIFRQGKIAWKRWKRKVCEQKADESCWWVTWMGDRRLRLSCPKNSFGSKNLDFLSPKVRRLPEFEFLVLKTQRMDALSQTQSNVSFLDTCKIAKNKTLRSLAPFKDLLRFLIIKTAGTLWIAAALWQQSLSS